MARNKYDEDYKQYSPAQVRKAKKAAKDHYINSKGESSVKVLSRVAKVPQGVIREWMKEEDWGESFKEDPEDKVQLSEQTLAALESGAEQFGLSEQDELFCYHYLKTVNATTSAIKAGYSSSYAHNKAYLLLKKDKIQAFLQYIRTQRNQELFIDSMDIIQDYLKIARADMTDFVSFGAGGITLKNHNKVDGQIISKLKEGKDGGVSIELVDKKWAYDKIEKHIGMDWKQKIEEKKLSILEQKLELDKQRIGQPGPEDVDDDGFMKALGVIAKEVWSDGED